MCERKEGRANSEGVIGSRSRKVHSKKFSLKLLMKIQILIITATWYLRIGMSND